MCIFMGNITTKRSDPRTNSVDSVYKQKEDHFKQINAHFNNSSSGRSFASISSHQSTYSFSRPWSRVSRRRWKESTLTLPYESSKTAWPVSQLESCFLPEFPVSTSYNEKRFDVIEEINKGSFGKVYKAQDLESGRIFALKVLSKSKIIEENSVQQVKDEVQIQKICGHHPFIVNCPFNWQNRKRLFIVTEYVEGGELFSLLKTYLILPLELVRLYIAQLALALDFLHNAGIVYRDLKPENILLDESGNAQLIDFGLSKWLSYGTKTKTICGTLRFMVIIIICRKMNARSQLFELTVECTQADEAVASIFHTLLFHRSLGKFTYTDEGSYSVGTVGYTDVDCEFIDLTYVCCSSTSLEQAIRKEISGFSEMLRGLEGSGMGQISLEFFQKKPSRWLFQPECIPWEVWTVRLELISLSNECERQISKEKVGELITDKIIYIAEVMNRHEYLPKMPSQSELDLIFDTSFPDVQPYLFKFNYSISGPSGNPSVGSTVKKLIRETLAL